MKNKKLNLSELRVKSFITTPTAKETQTVKGGFTTIIAVTLIINCFDKKTDDDNCAPDSQACMPGTGGGGSGNIVLCPDQSLDDCSRQYCH